MTFSKIAILIAAFTFAGGVSMNRSVRADELKSTGVEHLSGTLSKGEKQHVGNKGAKKSVGPDLVIHVAEHHGKKAGQKGAKHGKTVKLIASGEVLTKLTALAKKHAHVKVSGSISGDTMAVTDVTEEHHKGKK